MTLIQNFKKLFRSESGNAIQGCKQAKKDDVSVKSPLYTQSVSSRVTSEQSSINARKFSLNTPNDLYPDLPSKYKLLTVLGEGAFSIVYKAIDLDSNMTVAIKVINKTNLTSKQLTNIKNEISVMKKAKGHPNVLKLISYFDSLYDCFLILEYCNGGEIFNKIIEYTYLSEDLSRHIFKQLLSAVDYLHNKINIVHRDIKSENLIFNKIPYFERSEEEFKKSLRASDDDTKVDEGEFKEGIGGGTIGIIKLADFGLAKQLKTETTSLNSNLKTPCGTAGYTAPEVITCNDKSANRQLKKFSNTMSKKNYYSKSVDIWSLGCFLYTILCGFPPFYDDDPDRLTLKILKGEYVFLKPWWDEISPEVKDLITKMLNTNPELRIPIEEIWQHPWVKGETFDHIKSESSEKISDNYFPEKRYEVHNMESAKHSTHHIEFSDTLLPPTAPKNSDPLSSPRANAIKMVFNNPAMTNNDASISKNLNNSSSSVHFIEDVNETNVTSDVNISSTINTTHKRDYPKTPSLAKDDIKTLNFKDVFRNNRIEDDFGSENEDELASLDQGFHNIKRRNSSQKSSLLMESSGEDEDSDYQTRASSIISGINGEFKFTLNLNDSNILARRRSSTLKSLAKQNSNTSGSLVKDNFLTTGTVN